MSSGLLVPHYNQNGVKIDSSKATVGRGVGNREAWFKNMGSMSYGKGEMGVDNGVVMGGKAGTAKKGSYDAAYDSKKPLDVY